MSDEPGTKLALLREDFRIVTGRCSKHFFCPILWRDEAAELCEGHVINKAFPNSDRQSVLQRQDVDNFFGSRFEADFVLLRHRGKYSAVDVLLDRGLARTLRPQVVVDGVPLQHYLPVGAVPAEHSELVVEREGQPPVRVALKLRPSETLETLTRSWVIDMGKDLRLPALVSLLKAAHLTMFSLMGYSYGYSLAGRFLGWDILGQFAADNLTAEREVVLVNAAKHFPAFASLVRPMTSTPSSLTGTISDRQLFLCNGSPKPWAFMVFVRTDDQIHAVLVPVMEDEEGAARYVRFLNSRATRFEATPARFAGEHWEVATSSHTIEWPEPAFEAT